MLPASSPLPYHPYPDPYRHSLPATTPTPAEVPSNPWHHTPARQDRPPLTVPPSSNLVLQRQALVLRLLDVQHLQ